MGYFMNLNSVDYNSYIDSIIDIFKVSSKNESIFFDINIVYYKATVKMSVININGGNTDKLKTVTFDYNVDFGSHFLVPLVTKLAENINIVSHEIIKLNETNLCTLRVIVLNNDLFSINGLSYDDAKNLLNILLNNSKNNEISY